MNEKPSAWTPEEKSALFAAVEQFRATGGQLIGTRSPRLFLRAAQKPHKRCTTSCLRPTLSYAFAHPPHRPFRPQRVSRPCLRCRRPFELLGSEAELDLQFVQRTDRYAWLDRRLIHIHPDHA